MKTVKKAAWFAFFLIIAISCVDEPDCFQLNNNLLMVTYKVYGGASDVVLFEGIDAPGTDSIFYTYQNASSVELPLNPFKQETQFNFHTLYGDNQLKVAYTYKVQFVSEDCGERYIFSNLSLLSHDYDSIRFVGGTLTQPPSTNFEVYRCPRTNMAGVSFKKKNGSKVEQDTVLISSITPNFSAGVNYPSGYYLNVNLPLNPNAATTTFTFAFGDGTTKLLTLGYARTPWTKYEKYCGTMSLMDELAISAQDFGEDKVVQKLDSIQDPPVINLEIFK